MIQKIKCYRIFTFPLYRLCMFLLLPAGLLLLPTVLPIKEYFFVSCFGIVLFTSVEILADFWVFGGIARREGQLEYLKSSKKGPEVVRTALIINMIRQFLTMLIVMAAYVLICSFINSEAAFPDQYFIQILDLLLIGEFFTLVGNTVVRFLDTPAMSMGISAVCMWLMGLSVMVVVRYGQRLLLPAAILCAAAGVSGVWLVMKRVKESYYDKKD